MGGRKLVYNEERSSQHSVMSNDFVQNVYHKIFERQCFTISELSCEFPQISHTVFTRLLQLG
jgi:hypothetical protein